jgi:hypothetical protein
MRTLTLFFGLLLAVAGTALAQDAPAQGSASTASNADVSANRSGASATGNGAAAASASTRHTQTDASGGSEISATLSRPVDARKAKPGDPVTATNDRDASTADGTRIKRGSKLIGHVTRAQPLEKSAGGNADGSAGSSLGIVFDKAVTKDGREVPLNASIQALSAAESDAAFASEMGGAGTSLAGAGAGSGRAAGGGLVGGLGGSVAGGMGAAGSVVGGVGHGMGGTVGGAAGGTLRSAGAVGGLSSSGGLTSGSKGVFGFRDLNIVSSSAGTAEGSVITSPKHNVRLDGGTRMLLSDTVSHSGGAASGAATGAASGTASGAASGAPGAVSGAASGAGRAGGSASRSGSGQDSSGGTGQPSRDTREPRGRQ